MTVDKFKRHLKKHGHYRTSERIRLFELLEQLHSPATIQELVAKSTDMDEATVYRNLDVFEETGVTHRVYTGWKYKVELSDLFRAHHHHMTCENCDSTTPINDRHIENDIKKLAKEKGYVLTHHHLELHGLCPNCC